MPPLLLLPGNMCDARLWHPLGARLDAHGVPWRVAPALTAPTIAGMAADVLASQAGPMIVVGFSMGAIVALEMIRQAPGRIAAAALIALNAGADLPERAAARPRQQADVRSGGLARVVGEELKPVYFGAACRDDAQLRALTLEMALSLGPDTFVAQSEALRTREDLRTTLARISVPVLFACGQEDRLCPPHWHRQWVEQVGPLAAMRVFPGAGHMLPIEQPVPLADTLAEWLNEQEIS